MGESNRLNGSWIVPEYTTCNKDSAFEYLHKFKNCLSKFVQVFIDPLKEMSESKKNHTALPFWSGRIRRP